MSGPFTSLGKQVLANGTHYADAADTTAAAYIANAANLHAKHSELRPAAHDYLHAASDRTARLAADRLRAALKGSAA